MSVDITLEQIEEMTVAGLRDVLRKAGLKIGGSKPELKQRCKRLISGEISEQDKPKTPHKSTKKIGSKRSLEPVEETSEDLASKKRKLNSNDVDDASTINTKNEVVGEKSDQNEKPAIESAEKIHSNGQEKIPNGNEKEKEKEKEDENVIHSTINKEITTKMTETEENAKIDIEIRENQNIDITSVDQNKTLNPDVEQNKIKNNDTNEDISIQNKNNDVTTDDKNKAMEDNITQENENKQTSENVTQPDNTISQQQQENLIH